MLTVRESQALHLAGTPFRHAGSREHMIRDTLGYSEARFAQVVGALLDRPDALAAHPQLVHRLRRVRDQRRRARSA